ncbi:MAG: M56 family metallopeptidase [Phycisphaerales bacterium]
MDLTNLTIESLWRVALAGVPIALLVWGLCRLLPMQATTRHTLWVVVLGLLLLAPLAPALGVKRIAAGRPPAGADSTAPASAPTPPVSQPPAAVPPPPASRLASPAPSTPVTAPIRITESLPARPAPADRSAPRSRDAAARPERPVTRRDPPPAVSALAAPALAGRGQPAREPLLVSTDRPTRAAAPPRPRAERPPVVREAAHPKSAAPAPARPATPPASPAPPAPAEARSPAPVPAAPPAASPAPPSALGQRMDQWRASLGHAWESLMAIPSPPTLIWQLGAAGILFLIGANILWCRWRLRSARPAPDEVAAQVALAAREMGLRRPPAVFMIRQRISPMIWCGLSTRLVLPTELWDELDEPGRRAVIQHELAHLRRRDHWVCWLELIACIVYWWHPVVWWVRHRLRDEADLCCDAWVTALMPRERRSYAQALLSTHRYLSGAHGPRPANSLGAMTGGTRRIARRLTMVMTHRARPNRSITGMTLAALVAGAGLLSTPLWACPPEETEAKRKIELKARETARTTAAQRTSELARAQAAQEVRRAVEQAQASAKRERTQAAGEAKRVLERAQTQATRDRTRAEAEAMRAAERAQAGRAPMTTSRPQPPAPPKAPKPPKPPKAPVAVVAPQPPQPPAPPAGVRGVSPRSPLTVVTPRAPAAVRTPRPADDASTFEQHMRERAEGEARAAMRARVVAPAAPGTPAPRGQQGDLERRIERLERSLERLEQRLDRMHQQMDRRGDAGSADLFTALAIAPDATVIRSYTLPEGLCQDVIGLMSRQDVPVLVSPGDGEIAVHGTEAQQRAFRDFVTLIAPGEKTVRAARVTDLAPVTIELDHPHDPLAVPPPDAKLLGTLQEQAGDYAALAGQLGEHHEHLGELLKLAGEHAAAGHHGLSQEARADLEAKIEAINERIESVREHIESVSERAEELLRRLGETERERNRSDDNGPQARVEKSACAGESSCSTPCASEASSCSTSSECATSPLYGPARN